MRGWKVVVCAMVDLEAQLCELERTQKTAGPPVITYVDQSRIIIAFPYWESDAPPV